MATKWVSVSKEDNRVVREWLDSYFDGEQYTLIAYHGTKRAWRIYPSSGGITFYFEITVKAGSLEIKYYDEDTDDWQTATVSRPAGATKAIAHSVPAYRLARSL